MKIVLKSDIFVVKNIKRKTKAEMFKDLKAGDMIQLSVDASPVGGNKGTYASYIKIEKLNSEEYTHKSFNQIWELYSIFELGELCENY